MYLHGIFQLRNIKYRNELELEILFHKLPLSAAHVSIAAHYNLSSYCPLHTKSHQVTRLA